MDDAMLGMSGLKKLMRYEGLQKLAHFIVGHFYHTLNLSSKGQ